MHTPWLSLLLPSKRPDGRFQFLTSLHNTLSDERAIEVLVAVDEGTPALPYDPLISVTVDVEPGSAVPQMFNALLEHARGEFVMLCNDDLTFETLHWDQLVRNAIETISDHIVMVHPHEGMFGIQLCCFPIIPRRVLRDVIQLGTLPYKRYCLDPHIQRVFDLVGRRIYLPNVKLEHRNCSPSPVEGMSSFPLPNGSGYYVSDPVDHAHDQRCFERMGERMQGEAVALKALMQDVPHA